MSSWGKFSFPVLAAICVIAVNGCVPTDSSASDDEKEQHYLQGKSCVNAMDYAGAIEAFRESLEVNPHSAAAHYQLALLFENQTNRPEYAIYHYSEFLRLNPKADNSEVVRQHIESCKMQLAANVGSLPSSSAAQRQLESLMQTNHLLQAQISQLQAELNQWRAYSASQQNAQRPTTGGNLTRSTQSGSLSDNTSGSGGGSGTVARPARRTHVVAAGETLASIARSAGVSLAELQAANPTVTPKKLKIGQTLNLP